MLKVSFINKLFLSLAVFIVSIFMLEDLKSSNVNVAKASTLQKETTENLKIKRLLSNLEQDEEKNSTLIVGDDTQYKTKCNTILKIGYKVVTTIPRDSKVTVVSKSGNWYKVEYKSNTGYVKRDYLSKINRTPSNKPVPKGYKIPILMYHAIDEIQGGPINELYVSPKNFEEQMKYLKSSGFTPINFDDLPNINQINKPILITFDDGYKNNINAYNVMKKLNDAHWKAKGTIFMIGNKIDGKNGLTTKDIKEMSDSEIISFQSHTETHPNLTETTDYNKELGDIKKKLEKITGKPINAIAYPSGQYDSNVMNETKKYYKYAVTTIPGIADTGSDLTEMKRIRVSYSTSLESFEYMVNQ